VNHSRRTSVWTWVVLTCIAALLAVSILFILSSEPAPPEGIDTNTPVAAEAEGARVTSSPKRQTVGHAELEPATLFICSRTGSELNFDIRDRVTTRMTTSGHLERGVNRERYSAIPGLHVIATLQGHAPSWREWPASEAILQSLPPFTVGLALRLQTVDASGKPVAGVDVVARPSRMIARDQERQLWQYTTDSSGYATTDAVLPIGETAFGVVGGALPLPSHLYAVSLPQDSVIPFVVKRGRVVHGRFSGRNADAPSVYYRTDDGTRWMGPLALDGEFRFRATVSESADSIDFGLFDPLLGETLEFATLPLRATELGNVDFPPLADLRIVTSTATGPCDRFAIFARGPTRVYRPFSPRLLGDVDAGELRLTGLLPGDRWIRVVPFDHELSMTEFRLVHLGAGANEQRFYLSGTREVLVHVMSAGGEPIGGAKVTLAQAPLSATDALHLHWQDSRTLPSVMYADKHPVLLALSETNPDGVVGFRISSEIAAIGVLVRAQGFITACVESRDLSAPIVDVVLGVGGAVEVHSPSTPPKGFRVWLTPESGPWKRKELALSAQSVRIDSLASIGWNADLRYQRQRVRGLGRVQVTANETKVLTLAPRDIALQTVRARAVRGERPLGNAVVLAWIAGTCPWRVEGIAVTTDAGGRFELTVPEGSKIGFGSLLARGGESGEVVLYSLPTDASQLVGTDLKFFDLGVSYSVLVDGKPWANEKVRLRDDYGGDDIIETDGAGVVQITRFPVYHAILSVPGHSGTQTLNPLVDSARSRVTVSFD